MQFHIWKNEGAEGPVIFRRDTIYLHHQNVGVEGPMLLFRRDISLYSVPPPPTSSTFAPVDLTAPKVAAGKNMTVSHTRNNECTDRGRGGSKIPKIRLTSFVHGP